MVKVEPARVHVLTLANYADCVARYDRSYVITVALLYTAPTVADY